MNKIYKLLILKGLDCHHLLLRLKKEDQSFLNEKEIFINIFFFSYAF